MEFATYLFGYIFWASIFALLFIGLSNRNKPRNVVLKPRTIGTNTAEAAVFSALNILPAVNYRSIHNLLLPSYRATTNSQIDHLVVSHYGIFCIETKGYVGWIYGSENNEKWTRTYYSDKKQFYNPIRQNSSHIRTLNNLLADTLKRPIISIIVFPKADKLNVSSITNVVLGDKLLDTIKKYDQRIYSGEECEEIYKIIEGKNISSSQAHNMHAEEVSKLIGAYK